MRIKDILGDRAKELKKKGEDAMLFGIRAADMTRDELLIFLGMAGETHIAQGEQMKQVSEMLHALSAKFDEPLDSTEELTLTELPAQR